MIEAGVRVGVCLCTERRTSGRCCKRSYARINLRLRCVSCTVDLGKGATRDITQVNLALCHTLYAAHEVAGHACDCESVLFRKNGSSCRFQELNNEKRGARGNLYTWTTVFSRYWRPLTKVLLYQGLAQGRAWKLGDWGGRGREILGKMNESLGPQSLGCKVRQLVEPYAKRF